MSDMTTFDYASKIASLLATAESLSAQGNEDAAAGYIAKASELQLKMQIDASDVRAAGQHAPIDGLDTRLVRGLDKGSGYIKAKRDLVYGLCAIMNVKTTIAHDRSYVRMFGHQTDLDFVQQLFDSLATQLGTHMAHDARVAPSYIDTGRSWRTSFAHGWAARVVTRLRAARTTQTSAAGTGAELMIRDRKAVVVTYFDQYHGGRKLGSSYKNRSIRDAHGFSSGDAAGTRADIGGTRLNQGDGARRQLR